MRVALEALLSGIGRAVQESQTYLERQAVESYCGYFHPLEQSDGNAPLTPMLQSFQFPDGKGGYRVVEVSQSALAHHNSMALDTVLVRLHIHPELEETGGIQVEVGPGEQEGEAGDVLELTFRTCPMAEGIARVNQRAVSVV